MKEVVINSFIVQKPKKPNKNPDQAIKELSKIIVKTGRKPFDAAKLVRKLSRGR